MMILTLKKMRKMMKKGEIVEVNIKKKHYNFRSSLSIQNERNYHGTTSSIELEFKLNVYQESGY